MSDNISVPISGEGEANVAPAFIATPTEQEVIQVTTLHLSMGGTRNLGDWTSVKAEAGGWVRVLPGASDEQMTQGVKSFIVDGLAPALALALEEARKVTLNGITATGLMTFQGIPMVEGEVSATGTHVKGGTGPKPAARQEPPAEPKKATVLDGDGGAAFLLPAPPEVDIETARFLKTSGTTPTLYGSLGVSDLMAVQGGLNKALTEHLRDGKALPGTHTVQSVQERRGAIIALLRNKAEVDAQAQAQADEV